MNLNGWMSGTRDGVGAIWLGEFFNNEPGDFRALCQVCGPRKNALEVLDIQPFEVSRRHERLRHAICGPVIRRPIGANSNRPFDAHCGPVAAARITPPRGEISSGGRQLASPKVNRAPTDIEGGAAAHAA